MNKHSHKTLDAQTVQDLLPHRPPLLLLQGVEDWGEDYLIGYQCLSGEEPVFQGHFPGDPIYPGVYLIEGLAQASAALLYLSTGQTAKDGIYYLASLADVKFRRPVYPGDTVQYRINFKKRHGRFVQVNATAYVQDHEVCSAVITSAQGKRA